MTEGVSNKVSHKEPSLLKMFEAINNCLSIFTIKVDSKTML